jgi:MFS family permease
LSWLSGRELVSLRALIAVAILLGVARAFSAPALNALGPNLVPTRVLPHAIAINSIATRVGAIVGPAVGGYLYASAPSVPYAASAMLLGGAFIAISSIRPVASGAVGRDRNPWRQILEGLRYVAHNRLVLGAISLDLFAVLLGGATAMLPIYAHDVLKIGPAGLGHLRAAPAAGAMLVALLFSYRPLERNVGPKMLVAVAVFGAATIGFGLSRSLFVSLAYLAILGGADMFSVYVRQSLIQISTPDEMRGRVGAVSSLFISASNELGEMESGFLAALIGPVSAVVAGGAGALAVTVIWARLFPALRRARTFHEARVPER